MKNETPEEVIESLQEAIPESNWDKEIIERKIQLLKDALEYDRETAKKIAEQI